ncbi:hypothetical protein G7046_g2875 [Stylonectria norvegica]|nr:hypothetical protein G7046_g2875 [Stylonectria norvegica]
MSHAHEGQKRHCWECLRRRLVCDSTRPVCKGCSVAGVVCPGYDDVKPLRWLAPGRVVSRNHKPMWTPAAKPKKHPYKTTSRRKVEVVVDLPVHSSVRGMVNPRFQMRTDLCAAVEASEYFNTCIYQDLLPILDLGPNPHIYRILPIHLLRVPESPDHIRLSYICIILSHRMNRARSSAVSKALAETYYTYRGMAIRSLNSEISSEKKCRSDVLLAGVITFLLADAQQGALRNWRCHLEGAESLIALRGGIRVLAESDTLESPILCFVFMAVMGNTTSPASDLTMTAAHRDELDFLLERYGRGTFPFHMCPPSLFAEIIRINHLRKQATKLADPRDLAQEAYQILSRINSFSSEQWAEPKPASKEDWTLLGNMHQTAVALYCISSLQSLSVLPLSSSLQNRRTTHGQHLHILLSEAVATPSIRRFVLWALVVLGMEAVDGGAAMRAFVESQLREMSCYLGTYVPLTARAAFLRFWASGKTSWDECFDMPYVFPTQVAVDMERIER